MWLLMPVVIIPKNKGVHGKHLTPENLHILGRCYVKLKCYVLSIHPGEGGSDLQTPYYLVGHPWLKANAGTTIKLWVFNILWMLANIRKGTQLLKFLQVLFLYYGIDNAWGRYTPKVPCRHYQCLPILERKHWTAEEKLSALWLEWWRNPLMYNLESGLQHRMSDLCRESEVKYLRLWKDVMLIFAVWRKWGGKDKGGHP